jgi:hypothetical protein
MSSKPMDRTQSRAWSRMINACTGVAFSPLAGGHDRLLRQSLAVITVYVAGAAILAVRAVLNDNALIGIQSLV